MSGRPIIKVTAMNWTHIEHLRESISMTLPAYKATHKAWLIPDGEEVRQHVWVKVPVKRGVGRALSVRDMEAFMWLDCGRGAGAAFEDLDTYSMEVTRFPFDEPMEMKYTYTIVVTSQRTSGGFVHPLNTNINSLVPGLSFPWRGNVLVFRHGRTEKRAIVNMTDGDAALIDVVLKRVFRERLLDKEDLGGQM